MPWASTHPIPKLVFKILFEQFDLPFARCKGKEVRRTFYTPVLFRSPREQNFNHFFTVIVSLFNLHCIFLVSVLICVV